MSDETPKKSVFPPAPHSRSTFLPGFGWLVGCLVPNVPSMLQCPTAGDKCGRLSRFVVLTAVIVVFVWTQTTLLQDITSSRASQKERELNNIQATALLRRWQQVATAVGGDENDPESLLSILDEQKIRNQQQQQQQTNTGPANGANRSPQQGGEELQLNEVYQNVYSPKSIFYPAKAIGM